MQQENQQSRNKHRKKNRAQDWKQQKNINFDQELPPQPQPMYPYHETETLLSWEAPGRPFMHRSKEYFINAFLIMMALEIILFLFSQYLLMAVVLSLVFLSFAMASIPPHKFTYKISTEGIQVEKHFFLWDELYDFYVFKTHGQDTIYVGTKLFFPGELTIMPGDLEIEEIKEVLLYHLPFREHVEPTFLEKSGRWLEKNFPLEKAKA